MGGEGQWQREQEGSEEEGLNQRGGSECHTGAPSPVQGCLTLYPYDSPEAQGAVLWESPDHLQQQVGGRADKAPLIQGVQVSISLVGK